jgi:hypothetical protein
MKKFIKFIKEEQEKLEPTKKKFTGKKKSIRHPEMPDDSISEITDLEKEEVMAKYYEDRLTAIDKKKRERAEARRRLRGEDKHIDMDEKHGHICKKGRMGLNPYAKNPGEEIVIMELRPKSAGVSLHDEEGSAHQFSVREISIQADEEEKLDLDMQVSKFNATIGSDNEKSDCDTKSRYSITKRNMSMYNMSPVGRK